MIDNVMSSDFGQILISVILGLGLASFFRKVCKNGRCIVVKGPTLEDVKKNIYKIDNECFKYTPLATNCK
jgi:hypothetical protein